MNYQEKLLDPRWQRKRLEIMNRDNFTCQYCGDTETTLNIHHLSYEDNPWESHNDQLLTLCRDCHSLAEYFVKRKKPISIPIQKVIKAGAGENVVYLVTNVDKGKPVGVHLLRDLNISKCNFKTHLLIQPGGIQALIEAAKLEMEVKI